MLFTTYLCNIDITITNKMLLQAISELQSKRKDKTKKTGVFVKKIISESILWFSMEQNLT